MDSSNYGKHNKMAVPRSSTTYTFMEALALYEHAQSNQTNLKHALADATEQLQEAMMAVHDTQCQLVDADFQLGRARHIARTSGYPEILTQEHPRILQVISYDDRRHSVTIPGGPSFMVWLD
ncbi:hypothetical protein JOM56_014966 [Amanita muscaria]